ncbi:MAG: hypothetical protein HeimC3_49820 [Candidatus Heimdallarchaeota archaeon LC_3]|nr:MAG: hypothetical protein HeimC3_49820 [Candidatus Heimdallarchaeota archaeon LC_3]
MNFTKKRMFSLIVVFILAITMSVVVILPSSSSSFTMKHVNLNISKIENTDAWDGSCSSITLRTAAKWQRIYNNYWHNFDDDYEYDDSTAYGYSSATYSFSNSDTSTHYPSGLYTPAVYAKNGNVYLAVRYTFWKWDPFNPYNCNVYNNGYIYLDTVSVSTSGTEYGPYTISPTGSSGESKIWIKAWL